MQLFKHSKNVKNTRVRSVCVSWKGFLSNHSPPDLCSSWHWDTGGIKKSQTFKTRLVSLKSFLLLPAFVCLV